MVEGTALEKPQGRKLLVSSNLTPSAMKIKYPFNVWLGGKPWDALIDFLKREDVYIVGPPPNGVYTLH